MTGINRFSTTLAASVAFLMAATAAAQTITGGYSSGQVVSPRMSDLHGATNATGPTVIHHPFTPSHDPHQSDGATQATLGPLINATGGVSFDGMNIGNGGYIPSDNNIAVGPNHVVEVVNAAYAVYSKSGATLLTPRHLGGLWTGLTGSTCSQNSGDTVVQYDRLADRWMITQLGSLSSPYSECVAVSTTNDPTGSFFLYTFPFGSNLNDYPKWGVWPPATGVATKGAYLATYNLFANGQSFAGAQICAYDRAAMLAGAATAGYVCASGINGASYLPIDLDGPTPPPDGTPAYFMDLFGGSLGVYTMAPNFTTNPPSATLSAFSTIGVAGYSQASSSPQPGTTRTLDSLSDRAMYRLAYRKFSDHDSIVLNHSVAAGSGNSGVRWYELQSTTGTYSMHQQGTYAPDSSYRWMGSAAMDQAGDIAIGYSVSDASSTFPSVRYTGRVPTDALGTMETEGVIINGTGSQTGYTRWGDYSSMRIDPSDDCTFWYVNEYYPATSSAGWYTRIGSFKFSNCSTNPDFSISASPAAATIAPGSAPTSSISIGALNGYTGTVSLSASGCPNNSVCSFNPGSVTNSGTSTLTVATSSATSAGIYTVTVSGTDGVRTHTTTFTVTVIAPDFSISASPATFSVTQGKSNSSTITLTSIGGFGSSVALSAGNCPGTCTFSPSSVTPTGSSVLTVMTSASTPTGPYNVTVTGTSGSLSRSVTVTVTVNADFTISVSPTTLSVSRGSSGSVALTVGTVGTSTTVTLSASGLPNGATATFSPNPVTSSTSGGSTLTVATKKNTRAGTYTLTITGTNGSSTHTTTLTLTVH